MDATTLGVAARCETIEVPDSKVLVSKTSADSTVRRLDCLRLVICIDGSFVARATENLGHGIQPAFDRATVATVRLHCAVVCAISHG